MKVPLLCTRPIINKDKPLPEINSDDIENTIEKARQETLTRRKNKLLAQFDVKAFQEAGNSEGFKSPLPGRRNKHKILSNFRTPSICPKLINLSFSQPSSPKTPALGKRKTTVAATPCIGPNNTESDNFVISTPMVLNPLETLHKSDNSGHFAGVDILNILDDETRDVTAMENHIRQFSELELTDTTVVDYLLDISDNISLTSHERVVEPEPLMDDDPPIRRIISRRVFRHCKPQTEEEKISLRKIQKMKAREKARERKLRFTREETGVVRKSRRSRRPVRYT